MTSDIISLFGVVLAILTAESSFDIRPVTINRITMSEEIEKHWGYTVESIEQKLKDEAYLVTRQARSYDHSTRISTPNADGSIDRVAREAGLLRLLQRLQQTFGFLEYTVTGDMLVERGKATLELRARRRDDQVIRATLERPMDQLDFLMRDAGWALIRLIDPHVACAAILRRTALEGKPDVEATLACIDGALPTASDPDRPWLLNLKGVALTLLERRSEAFQTFRDSLTQDPQFAHAWLNIGALLAADGREQDALRAAETALRNAGTKEEKSDALTLTALAQERQGRTGEALDTLREAFRADRNAQLPLQLLLERLPADSAEAREIGAMLKSLSEAVPTADSAPYNPDTLLGAMPVKTLLSRAPAG